MLLHSIYIQSIKIILYLQHLTFMVRNKLDDRNLKLTWTNKTLSGITDLNKRSISCERVCRWYPVVAWSDTGHVGSKWQHKRPHATQAAATCEQRHWRKTWSEKYCKNRQKYKFLLTKWFIPAKQIINSHIYKILLKKLCFLVNVLTALGIKKKTENYVNTNY